MSINKITTRLSNEKVCFEVIIFINNIFFTILLNY